MQTGYDRLIAFGDVTWTDYQITAEMTLNAIDCVASAGESLIVGWTGNTYGDPLALSPDQPTTGHPFFAQAGYPPLQISANSINYRETLLTEDTSVKLTLGVKYIMKVAVQRNPNNTSSEFFLKVWPATATEPSSWNLQAQGDASTGAALLATHRADVSYGKITVVPLP
jgi:hypothetical protein